MLAAKIAITTALICSAILPSTTGTAPADRAENSQLQMLDLVNRLRSQGCQCGRRYMPPAKPLRWNPRLEKAAFAHAADMRQNRFFAHKGSNGSNIGDRARQAGYDWVAVGENIAEGYGSFSETLIAWKNSPGHCRNLMQVGFDEMAVSRIGDIWVQDFGASVDKYARAEK